MTLYKWDRSTPGNNATADATINWAEGQAPSSVNDSARGMMTAVAKYRDDIAGSITTGGTSTAYSVTTNQVFNSLANMNNAMVAFIPHTNCGATVTLNVDTLGAKPLRPSPGVELAAGALIAGTPYAASYNNSSGVWYLQNVYNIPAAPGSITGSMLATNTVAYSNIQQVTNARLLGNFSGGTANVSEYAIAGGLNASGTTLSGSLATQGAFKNLSIKVASTTTVTVAADLVVLADASGNTSTVAISSTATIGSAGALNQLASGLIAAIDTWYYVWGVSKADGTTPGIILSDQSTATGTFATQLAAISGTYTKYARIGAVQTIHASATLYGTWQLGRKAQYVVGLASTANLPKISSASTGSPTVPTWTSFTVAANGSFVPTTASMIRLMLTNGPGGIAAQAIAAPNNSYGVYGSATNPAPLQVGTQGSPTANEGGTRMGDFLLESTAIFYASNGTSNSLWCVGWEDNI